MCDNCKYDVDGFCNCPFDGVTYDDMNCPGYEESAHVYTALKDYE